MFPNRRERQAGLRHLLQHAARHLTANLAPRRLEAYNSPAMTTPTAPARRTIVASAIASAIFGPLLLILGAPMVMAETPLGILSLQMVWTSARAEEILLAWAGIRDAVMLNLVIDYGFMAAYSVLLWALLRQQAARLQKPEGAFLWRLAPWMFAAGAIDAIENGASALLFTQVPPEPLTALVISGCATIKFVLLALGIGSWLRARSQKAPAAS